MVGNVGRYICRLSLNDFIGSNENLIVAAMKIAADKVNRRIFFILWFKPEIISDSKIKQFYSDYEEELQYIGTRLINKKSNDSRDRPWFEIISEEDAKITDQFRFRVVYKKESAIEEIIGGISECVKAITFFNNKPEKKPKYIKRDR